MDNKSAISQNSILLKKSTENVQITIFQTPLYAYVTDAIRVKWRKTVFLEWNICYYRIVYRRFQNHIGLTFIKILKMHYVHSQQLFFNSLFLLRHCAFSEFKYISLIFFICYQISFIYITLYLVL